MIFAAIARKVKSIELGSDFFMYEHDAMRDTCRDCNSQFSSLLRRHHCRNCGGLFCESCTEKSVTLDEEVLDRCCLGCRRNETPGDNIRCAVEKLFLETDALEAESTRKVTSQNLKLTYGSLFDKLKGSVSEKGKAETPPPTAGYFEIINKTTSICCIKIVSGLNGTDLDTTWELARPSYYPLPPNEILHTKFDPTIPFIEIYFLLSNMNQIPTDIDALVYDTKSRENLSDCASVKAFRRFSAFRIFSKDHNVLLKYKGDFLLEPRVGNSIARVGAISKFLGSGSSKKSSSSPKADSTTEETPSRLDFSTNISIEGIQRITRLPFSPHSPSPGSST